MPKRIDLPRNELAKFYVTMGSDTIARLYGVSSTCVKNNLHRYAIPINRRIRNTEAWRAALRKPKRGISWMHRNTKKTRDALKKRKQNAKRGPEHQSWKPEKHTGELIECKCGCGELRIRFDKTGRERQYIYGHYRHGKGRLPSSRKGKSFEETYGKERAEEVRKKMKISLKGKVPWNKGKKHSKETKEKLKEAWGRLTLEGRQQRVRNALLPQRRLPSSLEKTFMEIVEDLQLPYKFVGDGSFLIDNLNPDFVNCNGLKIAIEVYRPYFKIKNHGSVEKYKSNRRQRLSRFGWRVHFFDTSEVNHENVLKILGGGKD